MAFPAAPYDGTKSIQAAEAWAAISRLFATSRSVVIRLRRRAAAECGESRVVPSR
jgi:hypothetical protein